jgi:hypothetical protein
VREAEAVNVHDALEEKQLIAEFLRGVVQSLLSGAFCGALCVCGFGRVSCDVRCKFGAFPSAVLLCFSSLVLFCCVFLGSWCCFVVFFKFGAFPPAVLLCFSWFLVLFLQLFCCVFQVWCCFVVFFLVLGAF